MSSKNVNLEILKLLGLGHLKNVRAVNVRMRPLELPVVTVQFLFLEGNLPATHITKKFKIVDAQ